MVEWMKSDINDLVIDREIGELYVQNMLDLLSKLEDINTGYIKID
jgi:Zn-dependent alcohol dehydrogenase